MEEALKQHSGELTIMIMSAMLLLTLLLLVPHLLRSHLKSLEMRHEENMRALEQSTSLPQIDERSLFAGRTAVLVPIVSICTAGTGPCLLAASKTPDTVSA